MADTNDHSGVKRLSRNGILHWALLPLVAFLVFSPFYDSIGIPLAKSHIFLMDMQRLTELLAIVAALAIFLVSIGWARQTALEVPHVSLLGWSGFFLIGLVSSNFSLFPHLALVEWSWLLCCLLATILISAHVKSDTSAAHSMVRLLVLSVVASYTPLYYMRNSDALFDIAPIIQPYFMGFNNIRVFSDFQTAVICLLPWALSSASDSKKVGAGAWGVAGCYTALAFEAGSRSLFLGQAVAASCVWLLLNRKDAMVYIAKQVKLWIVATSVYVLLFAIVPVLVWGGKDGSGFISSIRLGSSSRSELWGGAVDLILTYPWLGVGPMHFAAIPNKIAASPHNQILQVMVEFGAVAATLFILMMVFWLTGVIRGIRSGCPRLNADECFFSTSLLAALIALIAQSFVSPVFNNPHSQVLLVMVGGVLGAYVQWSPATQTLALPRLACFVVIGGALGCLAIFCLPWAMELPNRNICFSELADRPTKRMVPRFWQQGWLDARCDR